MFKTMCFATGIVIFSKLLGFFRDIALAYAYGTSMESDAYILALTAVNIFAVFFTAMTLSFMPIYKSLLLCGGREKLESFLNNAYTVIGSVTVVFALAGCVFAGGLASGLAPGFGPDAHKLSRDLIQIMMMSIPFTFFAAFQGQQLRANDHFIVPSAVAVPLNLTLIISLIFCVPIWGVKGTAWAYVIGTILQFLWFGVEVRRKSGYRFRPSFHLDDQALRRIAILTLPILVGNAIQVINTTVDRMVASGLQPGSIAALNFSNKLALFVISIISLGAGNICYAKMSELGAAGKIGELTAYLRVTINLLNLIVVPAAAGMMVLAEPIVQTVFEYGSFGSNSSDMTATALFFYAIGLVGYSLREMITRAYYSIQDSHTPMLNGAAAVAVNIAGNIVLGRFMGIGGLALATSISAIFGTLLLLINLRRRLGRIGGREMTSTFIKCMISALVMSVSVRIVYKLLHAAIGIIPLALLISILIGAGIYAAMVFVLQIPEVELAKSFVRKNWTAGPYRCPK